MLNDKINIYPPDLVTSLGTYWDVLTFLTFLESIISYSLQNTYLIKYYKEVPSLKKLLKGTEIYVNFFSFVLAYIRRSEGRDKYFIIIFYI